MQATHRSRSAAVAAPWPMSKGLIWGICLPVPIAGSILYYVWKNSHPDAAKYANRASWICWGSFFLFVFAMTSIFG